ncbi:MAG: response regulator transcription factor [Clostridiales bacterium]|nr:response regulator transcription factor [Clostridiales bacterium]
MYNVLVVEDEINILKLMNIRLTKSGFNVFTAENGEMALNVLSKEEIDLVVADVMMPVMDGFEFVERMRAEGKNIPVIFVTAKESLDDKRTGFNLGADDYMVKPIDHEELVLRINALLKRADIRRTKKLTIGSCTLDYESLSVFNSDGYTVQLSKKEFLILYKLLSYPERIFTKNQLMDEFWGYESDTYSDTVKVHINRIRNKISSFPEIDVITVRGLGYRGVKNG